MAKGNSLAYQTSLGDLLKITFIVQSDLRIAATPLKVIERFVWLLKHSSLCYSVTLWECLVKFLSNMTWIILFLESFYSNYSLMIRYFAFWHLEVTNTVYDLVFRNVTKKEMSFKFDVSSFGNTKNNICRLEFLPLKPFWTVHLIVGTLSSCFEVFELNVGMSLWVLPSP